MKVFFKKSFIFISIMFLCLLSSAENNLGKIYKQLGLDEKISYSADMEIEAPGGNNMVYKMFFKNGDIRSEGSQSGMNFIMIMKTNGTMFSYNDALKMWMKTEIGEMIEEKDLPNYEKTGTEDINGVSCSKFEAKDASTGYTAIVWTNDGMILKNTTINPQGVQQSVYYKNIQKTELEDALFAPPQNANVQDMGAMMKGILSQSKEAAQ
ncbi:MAG: hypothetical protein ACD_79C01415G0002 [uncultured bacterium]|nr:MAG: hypothetical protein ACD_79C01415G0002 [uncultured bacterium]